ncbi:hypothetical protein PAHAL_8G093200 [Panicum hallii]|uniref:Uncharacterized protein n=1 Tax=Panicum hallii TaxID=206008 RepID=A0A2T8I8B1_9POAL|nr:hypothetical protein PAHAL_8G093200 [Panicum hallii]
MASSGGRKNFSYSFFLSSYSSLLYPSSSNSFYSTKEFSIIIRISKSANCSLIAPAPIAISRFQNVAKPGVEKREKYRGFLVLGLAKEKSPYTRPSNFLRGLSKRFAI